MVPKDATLKLDGKEQKLVNGQFKTQVAKRIRTEIEVDHSLFEIQTHTIQMVQGGIDETFELVSCQKLKNCKPNWSAWGSWKECVPRCYNYYWNDGWKKTKSTKERTRHYLPDANYSQDDWKGYDKESEQCSNIPRCPNDKLKTIEVKNSDQSYSSNDLFYARVSNLVSSCTVNLDSNYNDFQYGNLDTFTNLNNAYDGTGIPGNCQNFNITRLTRLEILRWEYGNADRGGADGAEDWLGDYIKLKSDNWRVNYRCTNYGWIPANKKWYEFKCQLY